MATLCDAITPKTFVVCQNFTHENRRATRDEHFIFKNCHLILHGLKTAGPQSELL
jgi:hypothetical protein